MSEIYAGVDLSDLGIDIDRHKEALAAFARMELEPGAVRAALLARDLAFVRAPVGKICVYVERGSFDGNGTTELLPVNSTRTVIHETDDLAAASAMRKEVERYFIRHFPGRLIGQGNLPESDPPENGTYRVICEVRPV